LGAAAIAVAFWVLLALMSHGIDRPPVITQIQVVPPEVPLGAAATVRLQAADPDGGRLTYECTADKGRCTVADKNKPEATYSPDERAAVGDKVTLTVTVTDRRAQTSTGTQLTMIAEAAPAPAASPATPAGTNRPPTLTGGGPLRQEGDNPVVLEVTGSDPDGDEVTFNWELGPCLLSASAERARAEVRLGPGCDSGKAVLTWTDAHGATANTEWEIQR
jgi:hypothetical protein